MIHNNCPRGLVLSTMRRREHIAQANSPQHAGIAGMCKIELQQAVVNHSQKHQQQSAPDDAAIKLHFAVAAFDALRQAIRHGHAGNEHEHGKDLVVRGVAVPIGVLGLHIRPSQRPPSNGSGLRGSKQSPAPTRRRR